ncbi:MAG: hypothetical protein ABH871_07875 [Pseudomonadota bacterium]
MISAGFEIKQCGDNTQCTEDFTRVKNACITQNDENEPAEQSACISKYVTADTLPPYKDDLIFVAAGITQEDYDKMVKWKAKPASADQPAPADKPAAAAQPQPAKPDDKPAEDTSSARNYYFLANGELGICPGSQAFENLNPGQESRGTGLFCGGGSLHGYFFELTPGTTLGLGVGFSVIDQPDNEHTGTTLRDPIPPMFSLDFGPSVAININDSVLITPYAGISTLFGPKFVMGAEGTVDANGEDNGFSIFDTVGPAVNVGVQAIVNKNFLIGGKVGYQGNFTSGRTDWEDNPANMANHMLILRGVLSFGVPGGSTSSAAAETEKKEESK